MIGQLFHFLFHIHDWEIHKEGTIYNGNQRNNELPIGRWVILKCKKCGYVKRKNLYAG